MITPHFGPLLELYNHTIIVKFMTHQCDFMYRVKSYVNIMLTIPVNHDHMVTQNVNKDLLFLKCMCHLKTLNICKFYMITGHAAQKSI